MTHPAPVQATPPPPKRLAYADPPYPGRAHLYADHPDYAGEVDHFPLIDHLNGYDGWALSTSAEALRDILPLCPPKHRVLAWVKHTITVSWEPVIVVSARKPEGVRDWIQVEPDSYQWRDKPDGYVIGQKPEAFCRWVFEWLGARPEDTLDDLYPGSGNVSRAWDAWRAQPGLPIARSHSAEKRAERRELAKTERPSLLEMPHASTIDSAGLCVFCGLPATDPGPCFSRPGPARADLPSLLDAT